MENPLKTVFQAAIHKHENLYTVLVYHKGDWGLYDALIGMGQAQSFALER